VEEEHNKSELEIKIIYGITKFGHPLETKVTPLTPILLPQRVKLETIFEYLFWRVNQQLLDFQLQDPEAFIIDYSIGKPAEFCTFTIYRDYPQVLQVQGSTIDVMLIISPTVRFKAATFYYGGKTQGWLVAQNEGVLTDKTLGECWKLVAEQYPDGPPKQK
jgi:hypothetical protein